MFDYTSERNYSSKDHSKNIEDYPEVLNYKYKDYWPKDYTSKCPHCKIDTCNFWDTFRVYLYYKNLTWDRRMVNFPYWIKYCKDNFVGRDGMINVWLGHVHDITITSSDNIE
jgi:hypothetical protein